MTSTTFAVDPADIPAVKRWLAAQDDPQGQLRSVDIDEILIGSGVLLDLPFVLQRAGVTPGSKVLLVVDETPMPQIWQFYSRMVLSVLFHRAIQQLSFRTCVFLPLRQKP